MIRWMVPWLECCLLALLLSCSNGSGVEEQPVADTLRTEEQSVELPGAIIAPTGDTLTVDPGVSVMIYYWLPLDLYPEMERDLLFLAALDSSVVPVPIQPDPETRNHAQRVVNDLGVSMSVYLADSSVMRAVDFSILPFCMLLVPGREAVTGTGFGAPSRLLSGTVSGE